MTFLVPEFDGDSQVSSAHWLGMTGSDDPPNYNFSNRRTIPSGAGQKRLHISCARPGRPPCGQIPIFLADSFNRKGGYQEESTNIPDLFPEDISGGFTINLHSFHFCFAQFPYSYGNTAQIVCGRMAGLFPHPRSLENRKYTKYSSVFQTFG